MKVVLMAFYIEENIPEIWKCLEHNYVNSNSVHTTTVQIEKMLLVS
jgi:hypothetical protein